jgi:hypothetical protein
MPGLIARNQASRIEAYTGVNPDELNEQVSAAYRALLLAEKNVKLTRQLKDFKLYELIERRRAELTKSGQSFTESALKAYANSHPEYREAIHLEDESDAERIELEVEHKRLKNRLTTLYKEAGLARDELYTLRQKQ